MTQASLYIGRFQPFHKGHLFMIQHCPSDLLYIGIGSSQYDHRFDNPFTFEERKKMIELTLDKQFKKQYKIYPVPDIHDPPNWVAHVKKIIPSFSTVLTNNSFTKDLFSEKGYDVFSPGYYQRSFCMGKIIRERLRNDQEWEQLVPEEIIPYLKKIDASDRLKQILDEENNQD